MILNRRGGRPRFDERAQSRHNNPEHASSAGRKAAHCTLLITTLFNVLLKEFNGSHSIFIITGTLFTSTAAGSSLGEQLGTELTNQSHPQCRPPRLGLTVEQIEQTFGHHVDDSVAHDPESPPATRSCFAQRKHGDFFTELLRAKLVGVWDGRLWRVRAGK